MPNDWSDRVASDVAEWPRCRPVRDVVSDVLHDLRLPTAAYGRNEFTTPWGVDIPPEPGASN